MTLGLEGILREIRPELLKLHREGSLYMPKILEDLRKKIAAGNPKLSKSSTYAISTAALQKQGKLPKAKGLDRGGRSGRGR